MCLAVCERLDQPTNHTTLKTHRQSNTHSSTNAPMGPIRAQEARISQASADALIQLGIKERHAKHNVQQHAVDSARFRAVSHTASAHG